MTTYRKRSRAFQPPAAGLDSVSRLALAGRAPASGNPPVIRAHLTAVPAQGRLSVRDVRLTTRPARTVRYLIALTTS